MIKVLLVDDHPIYRQGLKYILEKNENIKVVGEASDGKEAMELAKKLSPDVAIVDINLPYMNGLELTRFFKIHCPNTAVILITGFDAEYQLFHALKAGAAAYLTKEISPDKLIEAVEMVAKGYYLIGEAILEEPAVARWLLGEFERLAIELGGEPGKLFTPLSSRELQVLQLIAKGYSNKQIALTLGIKEQTVKNHLTSILRKLAVNDRTQAVLYALRRGWIRLNELEDGNGGISPLSKRMR
ncbi:MAG: response regulator transcription factor [Anaerolineae bacterium]|nr:response regulator transcription factor [Anaerolineae bacterium]MDW8102156.1 response regulator transcription factor [Anaerolineae bacterium]